MFSRLDGDARSPVVCHLVGCSSILRYPSEKVRMLNLTRWSFLVRLAPLRTRARRKNKRERMVTRSQDLLPEKEYPPVEDDEVSFANIENIL